MLGNTYWVPSRLIGTSVLVRVRAETLEGYVGTMRTFTLPRPASANSSTASTIIISSGRRSSKPGAKAFYRSRDELFPTTLLRQAYDRLVQQTPASADREYVRVLHLAASTAESEVETALSLLLEADTVPTAAAVRELVGTTSPQPIPRIQAPSLDLSPYDRLLPSRRAHA